MGSAVWQVCVSAAADQRGSACLDAWLDNKARGYLSDLPHPLKHFSEWKVERYGSDSFVDVDYVCV